MKIVDRKAFLAMEGPVLYRDVECAHIFGDLKVKHDTLACNDFVMQLLDWAGTDPSGPNSAYEAMFEEGVSAPFDADATQREAMYLDDGHYMIYEPADVAALIEILRPCAEVKA